MYHLKLQFRDKNMPAVRSYADTEPEAITEGSHLLQQYAGVRSLIIVDPDGAQHCYGPAGNYLFTIPEGYS